MQKPILRRSRQVTVNNHPDVSLSTAGSFSLIIDARYATYGKWGQMRLSLLKVSSDPTFLSDVSMEQKLNLSRHAVCRENTS